MKTISTVGIIILITLIIGITLFIQPSTQTTTAITKNGKTYYAGNYQLQLQLTPEKPKIGNNSLTITVHNNEAEPVTDVILDMYAEMPAMGSMQAMREVVSIEKTAIGQYQGHYELPMNGSWPLTLSINSQSEGQATALFDINTSRAGVKLTQATPNKLAPQTNQTSPSEFAEFTVDTYRRQLIGVKTAEVICENMIKTIHLGAKISYNQSTLTDISLKYDAWIGQLQADYLGKSVRQGETLFTAYSPELVSAQDEYLSSLQDNRPYLRNASRKRLQRWGVNNAQIKTLQRRGKSRDYLPILSPRNGIIIEKHIVTGSAVKMGTSVLRLADLSTVWVEGEVYESDLALLKVGMEVKISLPEHPNQIHTAQISFIDAMLNPKTHSAIVRAELTNPQGLFKPNMFANMAIQIELGERIVIPEQAVIYSGKQRIVFIDKGNGRLLPKKIKTGLRNNQSIEVLEGLNYGEIIVTSGNFLIAAESKLKAGLAQW